MTENEKCIDFLRRSYFAVDGLWFVTCENHMGFEGAMKMDQNVWEIMAKIQARKAREITEGSLDLEGLTRALILKFESEGWGFEVERGENEVSFHVNECPWYSILKKSDRTHLEPTITQKICRSEYQIWGGEFGGGINFSLQKESPEAGSCCMVFRSERLNEGE